MGGNGIDLSVTLGKIKLKNPVIPAAGTFGYGEEFAAFINLNDLGAIIPKCVTLEPRLGVSEHRSLEIAGNCKMNTIGLQNVGMERFLKDKLPYLRQFDTPVIANIGGVSIEEYARVAEILGKTEGIGGIEINISCSNVKKGGITFGKDPDTVYQVVKAVREVTDLTIMPKLTPNVTDITVFGKACEEAGADAVSLINGIGPGMAIDIHTRRSRLGENLTASLGGPWLKPLAVRLVWQLAQILKIPVVGIGGIMGAEDALEFFIAGATAVEIGTASLIDPQVTIKTIDGIGKFLEDEKISSLGDIIGSFKAP